MIRVRILSVLVLALFAPACTEGEVVAVPAGPGPVAEPDGAVPGEAEAPAPDGTPDEPEAVVPEPAQEEPPIEEPPVEEPPVEEPPVEEEPVLAIFAVNPSKGLSSGSEQVEITGSGFQKIGLPSKLVFFGQSLAPEAFVLSDSLIIAVTPACIPGVVDVTVTDGEQTAVAVLESGFVCYNPVDVLSIEPTSGHVLGGEPVTVYGQGFLGTSNVLIGGRAAIGVEVIDDGTILAITPDAGTPGPVDVHVSNDLGVGTLSKGFTYFETPRVDAVSPVVGPVAGGTKVEVKGAGFLEPLVVTVGGLPLKNIEVKSAEKVSGVVPAAAAPGTVDVVVATGYGSALGKGAYTYLEDLAPGTFVQVLAVSPPSGPAAGGNVVTVVAKGLTDPLDTQVSFGGKPGVLKGVDPVAHTILVQTPPGVVGAVDVTVQNSNGSNTLVSGYTYEPFIKVYEVLPNLGPKEGGTAITVSGVGFKPGLQLRVGALPASNVQVPDSETITAVTPPGSPGLANVTVLQGGLKETLAGGFAYLAEMDLFVVDPAQGSQAGGTEIQLIGSGFPTDATVLVGGVEATHVNVLSPTEITCRTPPGAIGTVDVTVVSNEKGTVTLPLSFTYFDPESFYGGTWGAGVDGAVNVTVYSYQGATVAGAFVILWTDPTTKYQGFTNSQGQITFSGTDLGGEQMVSASKKGCHTTSVVEYDAENITLFINCPPPPSPGGPPPGDVAPVFVGQVKSVTKYVPVPFGNCAANPNAPGKLCDTCETKADCLGLECSEIPGQTGKWCTSHCNTNADCPDDFMCYPLFGIEEHQCIPSNGEVAAFCDYSKTGIFDNDHPIAMPGVPVDPDDWTFELPIPPGEFAVFCWGGIWNDKNVDSPFTPYVLGVKRHLFALPGDVLVETILLNIPLNATMPVRFDDPPKNPGGPHFGAAFLYLVLGSDGVIEFLDLAFDDEPQPGGVFGDDKVEFLHVPKELTGDLQDASYTILAGAFSNVQGNLPLSIHLRQEVKRAKDDTFFEWSAAGWIPKTTGITNDINALAGFGESDVVGVGTDGLIIRKLGEGWAYNESGTANHLLGVAAVESGHIIAVGQGGVATHFEPAAGGTWTVHETPGAKELRGVWMAAPDDALAVGSYVFLHWDGAAWTDVPDAPSRNYRSVWGFGDGTILAVGNTGSVVYFDGTTWSDIPTLGIKQNLRSVWGPAPGDAFLVGEGGTVFRWNGVELAKMEVPTTDTLHAVWGTGPNDVWVVGGRGTILHWDGVQWIDDSPSNHDGAFFAVGGTASGTVVATGTHELLLSPFLQVPEQIVPANGGTMGKKPEDLHVKWTVKDGVAPHFNWVFIDIPTLMGPVLEWDIISDWDATDIYLPDLPNIEGTPGLSAGPKQLTIIRAYKEGFDIDNFSFQDFNQLRWQAWAFHVTGFTKL